MYQCFAQVTRSKSSTAQVRSWLRNISRCHSTIRSNAKLSKMSLRILSSKISMQSSKLRLRLLRFYRRSARGLGRRTGFELYLVHYVFSSSHQILLTLYSYPSSTPCRNDGTTEENHEILQHMSFGRDGETFRSENGIKALTGTLRIV